MNIDHDAHSPSSVQVEAEHWFARLRHRPGDRELLAQFNRWHSTTPENAEAYADVQSLWNGMDALAGDDDIGRLLRGEHRPARRRGVVMAMAASVALLAISLSWWLLFPSAHPWTDYRSAHGQQLTVSLDDGSKITLDTDTELRVRLDDDQRRLVLVRGRALFDIHHNPARPLSVALPGGRIDDVGTVFQASANPGMTEVTLIEGALSVARDTPAHAQRLVPGESVHFNHDDWQSSRLSAEALRARSDWADGRLVFRETPLADVVKQLNRYGTHQVVLADPQLGQLQVNGILEIGEQESFLHGLEHALPLKVEQDAGRVTLSAQ